MPPQKPDILTLLIGSTSNVLTNLNPLTAGLNVVILLPICAFIAEPNNIQMSRKKKLCFISFDVLKISHPPADNALLVFPIVYVHAIIPAPHYIQRQKNLRSIPLPVCNAYFPSDRERTYLLVCQQPYSLKNRGQQFRPMKQFRNGETLLPFQCHFPSWRLKASLLLLPLYWSATLPSACTALPVY